MENQNLIALKEQYRNESELWLMENVNIQVTHFESYDIIIKDKRTKSIGLFKSNMDNCHFTIEKTNENQSRITYNYLFEVLKPCLFIKGTFRGEEITLNMLNRHYQASKNYSKRKQGNNQNQSNDLSDNFVRHLLNVYQIPPVVFDNIFQKYSFIIDNSELSIFQNLLSKIKQKDKIKQQKYSYKKEKV